MTKTRFLGEFLARFRQKNRPIRLRGHEAIALQPLNRTAYGDVGDAQSMRQINGARFARFGDKIGDQLHIILRCLLRMLFTRAPTGGHGGNIARLLGNIWGGGLAIHTPNKAEKETFDNPVSECIIGYNYNARQNFE